ncbi:MAG: phage tail protein [Blautia sp.]|nr:phage tail protein [Blautia sp.]
MLANGTTLSYKDGQEYKNLPGLKEIPGMGVDAEKVDNTVLTDPHKKYELGIGDLPNMVYKFKYDNTAAGSPYRLFRGWEADKSIKTFKEQLFDGTTTEFDAQVSVKRTGGGVNGVIEFDVTMFVQSDFTVTDPA